MGLNGIVTVVRISCFEDDARRLGLTELLVLCPYEGVHEDSAQECYKSHGSNTSNDVECRSALGMGRELGYPCFAVANDDVRD